MGKGRGTPRGETYRQTMTLRKVSPKGVSRGPLKGSFPGRRYELTEGTLLLKGGKPLEELRGNRCVQGLIWADYFGGFIP